MTKSELTRQKKKLNNRLKRKAAYDEVFNNPAGQMVLTHLLELSGISKFKDCSDVEQMWINFGERRLVFSILTELGRDPNQILEHAEQLAKTNYETKT